MAHSQVQTAPVEKADTSRAYRNYVLVILTLVYAFNFIDRQIIGILSPFIKADLGLDDAQLGLLKGVYFAILYTVVGIPIAWLADRYSRVNIIAISLTLWSGFTAASGLAMNYTQLALARIGVGIGEAGGSPPSHSIISDLFPKEKRAGALAVYSLGIPFGVMLAFFASAFFLQGGSADWRTVMISVGLPGVILALLLKFTVKEPKRTESVQTDDAEKPSVSASLKTLLKIPTWWGMALGISFGSFGNYAISTWIIDYYVRAFAGLDITQLLIAFGIINGSAYALGVWLGGYIADRWGKQNKKAYALLPAIALIIGVPALYFSLQVNDLWLSVGLMTFLLFTSGSYLGPSFAMAQTLAPINVRAMSTALFFFVLNIIALGGGPTITGIISQALVPSLGEVEALRQSLLYLIVPYALSIIVFLWTSTKIVKDWEMAESRGL
ncbi:MFS transporter [Alteromonas sp. KS69]|jgi:MFS family permease|uniref:spinster family MFS transporter n=1 Tax=Alteromonas TaxID=226 RepID=UPI000C5DDABB|nr:MULTISPECIES: MFS transporter [Alteromonas]MBB66063.1 MFS transporter [Rickettsiales bacterium]MBO7921718.1 MFS transporter [Alteromonas sp. K632G]MDP2537080.1 MFS transporter [Alteromonas stellipolaris]RUP76076.1 MFS transporter [Alteromonas sp. KS69]CAD5280098.1 MFS transporter [Alteromonas sp. 154]|tara:strand:- start:16867 stop:18186 length:1320 start_codon:yes stop_codon:yes gene_type:complete